MSVKTFFVKIGKDILAAVEYPFKHAAQLATVLGKIITESGEAVEEAPVAKQLIIGLVEQFEKLGPDVLADIAAKGFNFAVDAQTVTDLQGLFAYVTQTFFPGVEKLYEALADPSAVVTVQPTGGPAPDPSPSPAAAAPAGGVTLTH